MIKNFGITMPRKMNQDTMKNLQNLLEIWQFSLRCTSVLEIGCGTGIDLRLFPDTSSSLRS